MTETDRSAREQLVKQLAAVHRMVRHGVWALDHQVDEASVRSQPDAESTVREVGHRLTEQADRLERRLEALGGTADRHTPEATDLPSTRAPRASAAIGGDQEFLQRLALAYLQLRDPSQAQGDHETASLAAWCYEDTQHLIREDLGRARPRSAAADMAEPRLDPPGVIR